MPFDQPTRNRLARFVGDARNLLSEEFRRQLQHEYGLDPASGDVADLGKLGHLDDARRETARILRATLAHYLAGASSPGKAGPDKKARQEALQRIVREQAYTVLNRLAALRMAEARGLLIECVARGYQSQGFHLYAHLAGPALGETGAAYRGFLFSLFDELAVELPALFDRFSPQGRLFPREAALLRLLELLDAPDLAPLWGEDETLGWWIYQYFNSGEERRQMRAESQAPRDSRELAVRNQFFTPRYVVEFLTDNTLGRIWYEMTEGRTALTESCRYLVRRPLEIFLPEAGFEGDIYAFKAHDLIFDQGWRALPDDLDWPAILELGLAVDGYTMQEQLRGRVAGFTSAGELAGERVREYRQTGAWRGNSLELWLCLFFAQRAVNYDGDAPDGENLATLQTLYQAWRAALEREAVETDRVALLNQPVYIRPRPLKDPRQITMLDPACGSMHFGLYAFDLFERIYEEAWDMQASTRWPVNSDRSPDHASRYTFHASLLDDYPTKEALLRDLPRLIIEHNLHGIDIDPRAVQIAGLSLWLRAQRSWQAQGLRPGERPTIRRSHIVCAEPMPGEQALLEEFLAGLREDRLEGLIRRVLDVPATQQVRATARMAEALCDLVRLVWQEMRLAGEAGSLLKIEETLAAAIAAAEAEWSERWPLFRVVEFDLGGEAERVRYPRGLPGEDGADFWPRAEAMVLAALQDYAEQAQNGVGYQRRLFANDAAHGFAFIDITRKQYDVVLMNPPFGVATDSVFGLLKKNTPSTYTELYACFVKRGLEMARQEGRVGAITSRAILYISRLAIFRQKSLTSRVDLLLDLASNVMDDAFVEACAYTVSPSQEHRDIVAFDARTCDRREGLVQAVGSVVPTHNVRISVVPWAQLSVLPSSKLLYYLPKEISDLLNADIVFEPDIGTVRQGMGTFDDFRFVHLLWELPYELVGEGKVWEPLAKGGPFAKYYGAIHLAVNWWKDGGELREVNIARNGQSAQVRQASDYWRRGGCTYSKRSVKGFSARALPQGCIIAGKGPAIISQSSISEEYFLGWLNSRLITGLIELQANASEYNTGILKKLPWTPPSAREHEEIAELAHSAALRARSLRKWDETDQYFVFQPFVYGSLAEQLSEASNAREDLIREIATNDASITLAIDNLYGVDSSSLEKSSDEDTGAEDEDDDAVGLMGDISREYCEFVVGGCMGAGLGRWDIAFACHASITPRIPDPFDHLPSCPPGMLQNAQGLPAAPADVPADYPLRVSWPGILVDDPGHPEDIEARLREALRVIWPETADVIEQEACQILGVGSLREYFAAPNRFFDDHLKRYSKSRRVAPIYWPLSTPSGSYTLWLYYHRLSDQML